MNKLFFPIRFFYTLYAFLAFISILFLIFPFVVLASLFGRIRGGNLIYTLCRFWADCMFLWGIFHKNIFEVPHDAGKQFVFVFNHISFMDIPVIMKTIRKQHFRILGRADLAKLPIFGFLYSRAVVMVDRSDADKRAKSLTELKVCIAKGVSIMIAPEGTFNTTHRPLKNFYDGAFKVAIETQTPIKPILFLDNYDRLSYESVFTLSPGVTRSVFLEEVSVKGLTLDDVDMLKEKVYKLMEQKLISYNASWIRPVTTTL